MIHSRSKGEKTKNKGKWRNCGATVAQLWRNCGKKKGRLVSATPSLFPCPPFQKFPHAAQKILVRSAYVTIPRNGEMGKWGVLQEEEEKENVGFCRLLQISLIFLYTLWGSRFLSYLSPLKAPEHP